MLRPIIFWALFAPALLRGRILAQDPSPPKSIDDRFREMQDRYEHRISALEGEVRSLKQEATSRPDDAASALDKAIPDLPAPPRTAPAAALQLGPARVSLLDLSMDVLFA